MKTTAEWLGVLLLQGTLLWTVGSLSYSRGFHEGQRVQDTAYGEKLNAVIKALNIPVQFKMLVNDCKEKP